MQNLKLPYIILPTEFLELLKSNLSVTTSSSPVFDIVRKNHSLYLTLQKAFKEFDDGRGLEKTMLALGWSNFRDRMASIYIYKSIHGHFPKSTSMDLVEEIKDLEGRFINQSVNSFSRIFLLGFYLRLANIQIQRRDSDKFSEIKISETIGTLLRLSQGRSEKIDWLILIMMHLLNGLGETLLMNSLMQGKKFDELYELISPEDRRIMLENLLAYGASIQEQDLFLYDKI
jgi:hypothetical protein